jgi:hypothetical protein
VTLVTAWAAALVAVVMAILHQAGRAEPALASPEVATPRRRRRLAYFDIRRGIAPVSGSAIGSTRSIVIASKEWGRADVHGDS